jgi:succinate dehydrogenase / fumarate reductase iron-sulfur subunit
MSENMNTRNMVFKVFRFNREKDYLPYYKEYKLTVNKDELVLDILNRIKWEHDGSFSYRRSCRHGICGSCAIKVNGKSVLACKDNMFEVADLFGGNNELVIEPQHKGKAVKDMIVEKKDFWEKYNNVKPYLIDNIEEHPEMENIVFPEDAEKLDEADLCIQCGCCYYACPAVEVNPDYTGPAALALAYRFTADVRDKAKDERFDIINQEGSGIWDCVKCYECQEVCPKEINPIDKITKLHQMTFQADKAPDNVAVRHAVGFKWSMKKHGILDEGELVRYSEGNCGVLKHVPEAIHMLQKGKLVFPWNMPKSKNLDEIKTLIESSSTAKFKGK